MSSRCVLGGMLFLAGAATAHADGAPVWLDGGDSRWAKELQSELEASGFALAPPDVASPSVLARIVIDEAGRRVCVRRTDAAAAVAGDCVRLPDVNEGRVGRRRVWIAVVESLRARDPAPQAEPVDVTSAPPPAPPAPPPPADEVLLRRKLTAASAPPDVASHWKLGAGLLVALTGTDLGFTSHAGFVGQWQPRARLALWTRLLWPLQASFRTFDGNTSRLWSFGAEVGGALALRLQGRLRPYLKLGAGLLSTLAETKRTVGMQSDTGAQLGFTGLVGGGLGFVTGKRSTVFLEIEARVLRPIAEGTLRGEDGWDLSGAMAVATMGILFDY